MVKIIWLYRSFDWLFCFWSYWCLGEKNTREDIYDAFRRKETFATSGPRIKVRFFAGYEFEDAKLSDLDLVKNAYKNNLSMGSTIDIEKGKKPKFLVWATADSLGAPITKNSNH